MKSHQVSDHEIGGICVEMTARQAERWNMGDTTARDLNKVRVFVPERQNDYRCITLRRATNSKLEAEVADMMADMPANRCGAWKEKWSPRSQR